MNILKSTNPSGQCDTRICKNVKDDEMEKYDFECQVKFTTEIG